jgi:hypothetical protein
MDDAPVLSIHETVLAFIALRFVDAFGRDSETDAMQRQRTGKHEVIWPALRAAERPSFPPI